MGLFQIYRNSSPKVSKWSYKRMAIDQRQKTIVVSRLSVTYQRRIDKSNLTNDCCRISRHTAELSGAENLHI